MAQGLITKKTKNKTIRSKLIKIYIRFEAVEYKHIQTSIVRLIELDFGHSFLFSFGIYYFFLLFSISFKLYIFEIGILSFSLVYLMRGNMPIMWIDFITVTGIQISHFKEKKKWCCLYMVVIIIIFLLKSNNKALNVFIRLLLLLYSICVGIVLKSMGSVRA